MQHLGRNQQSWILSQSWSLGSHTLCTFLVELLHLSYGDSHPHLFLERLNEKSHKVLPIHCIINVCHNHSSKGFYSTQSITHPIVKEKALSCLTFITCSRKKKVDILLFNCLKSGNREILYSF